MFILDSSLNVSVRHAIKLLDGARDKWFIFCCRSAKEKQRWLEAFEEERRLVTQDKDDGLDLPPAARHLARVAAYRQKRPPRKLRRRYFFLLSNFISSCFFFCELTNC